MGDVACRMETNVQLCGGVPPNKRGEGCHAVLIVNPFGCTGIPFSRTTVLYVLDQTARACAAASSCSFCSTSFSSLLKSDSCSFLVRVLCVFCGATLFRTNNPEVAAHWAHIACGGGCGRGGGSLMLKRACKRPRSRGSSN
eukprot:3461463-Rhodomonas_salina.1